MINERNCGTSGSDQESYVQNRQRAVAIEERKQRIRELNDGLRRTFTGGYVTITAGLRDLGPVGVEAILTAVQQHDQFNGDNDPYEEHDFGSVTWGEHSCFFKIDYYDKQLEFGSPDPADPGVTTRVITIMLASEY